MKKSTRYEMRDTRYENGSALILAVVLTSLLAIVGVMFVMVARVDRIATSGISENKTLDSAVEVVIAKISQELALDVPRSDSNGVKLAEYYDYPGPADRWLASLEPYEQAGNYYWRQISDVTGFLADNNYDADDVDVKPVGLNTLKYVREYPEIRVNSDGKFLDKNGNIANEGLSGDADGDGVADSKWIELDDITSNKGKPIYAAIRIIDNGGMLNVNTVFADPGGSDERKGDMLTDIYIDGLVKTGTNYIDKFIENRSGDPTITETIAEQYHTEVSRRVENPVVASPPYTLYDISDELSLRNRFIAYNKPTVTRLESKDCFGNSLRHDNLWTPVDDPCAFKSWKRHVDPDHPDNLGLDPNESDNLYSFRKLLTTYNFDRIINPDGGKMVNINRDGAGFIYSTIKTALRSSDPNFKNVDETAAQIAVNLIDYRDSDPNVTTLDVNGITYYGFERPCIYISELVHRFKKLIPPGGPIGPGGEPVIYRSYAIELYKPYSEDSDPSANDWKLVIGETPGGPIGAPVFGAKEYYIDWSGTKNFHVVLFEDQEAELNVDSAASVQEPDFVRYSEIFEGGDFIELQRRVRANDGSDIWVTVDSNLVPDANANSSAWLNPNVVSSISRSVRRDITLHKCIRRLWSAPLSGSTLGGDNIYNDPNTGIIQAHPADEKFTNVGEIGMVFRKGAYYRNRGNRADRIGYSPDKDEEDEVRLDLADPNYHNIFKYLTVFDPSSDTINNDGDYKDGFENTDEIALDETPELKIPGRININTAPWYVIAQLPWMTDKIAQAIVAYRDKAVIADQNNINYSDRYDATDIDGIRETAGFASIGELATVVNDSGEDEYSMRYYALDSNDLEDFPDLTTPDHPLGGAEDDFEERDVIFARISNLVTVRSDVFTAYILVRIGADGPQKRVMAIFDRSNVYTGDGRVQIVALHPVADPR